MLNEDDDLKVAAVTERLTGERRRAVAELARKMSMDYDGIMKAAKVFLETGAYYDTFEDLTDHQLSTFWNHYESITSTSVELKEPFFTCCADWRDRQVHGQDE